MSRGRLRSWDAGIMQGLIQVARGLEGADLYFTGGRVIDVYSGTVIEANLAVKGERIAYLGDSDRMVREETQVIDVQSKFLAPGYIEPHAHPFQLYNPLAYADSVLTWGTTCSVNDNLLFMNLISPEQIIVMVDCLRQHPVKMLWSARLDPQTYTREAAVRFAPEAVSRLIRHPWFVQVGELTDWPTLIGNGEQMQRWMAEAAECGKKAEGHAPGASENTLNPLAAAGVTACHESIRAEEVLRRLRLGMYAALRCSSLRPDLPQLLEGLMKYQPLAWERMMMTTDSPTPTYFGRGFTDQLIRIAVEKGVPPVTAYQLVTRNPAVYHGLDDEIGGLAPGRLADILVLNDLEEPTPLQVFADGRLAVERRGREVIHRHPRLEMDWDRLGFQPLTVSTVGEIDKDWLLPPYKGENSFPAMLLVDPVITRQREMSFDSGLIRAVNSRVVIEPGSKLCYACLITRGHEVIAHGILQGFASSLGGIASSYTGSFDLLVIGQDTASMLLALKRVEEMGGGIAVAQKGEIIADIALPLGGSMSPAELDEVINRTARIEEVMYQAGYPHHDLIYSLLFMTSTHLPEIRLTRDGLWNVKERRLLKRSRKLR